MTEPQKHQKTQRRLFRRRHVADSSLRALYYQLADEVVTPSIVRRFSTVLLILFAVTLVLLIITPWVQTVLAEGRVTALYPAERPQYIHSRIEGRLVRWTRTEGNWVEQGDIICILQDVDPKFLDPVIVERARQHVAFLEGRLQQIRLQIDALTAQLEAERAARDAAVEAARRIHEQARQRLKAAEALLAQENVELQIQQQRFKDRKELFEKGLRSLRLFESDQYNLQQARARVERAQAEVEIARNAIEQTQREIELRDRDGLAKINKTQAELAKATELLAATQSALAKATIELANIEQRRSFAVVRSPIKGKLVRLYWLGEGEIVKQGDPLAIVMPEVRSLAVELMIKGNDAPLVYPGQKVRIQFDGFPALQISGFPQVNIGTFGGVVWLVDAVEDDRGRGMFRAIIKPDPHDEPWPTPDVLRPGTQARGWFLLRTVPLLYELWRQINGFPPSLERMPPTRREPPKRPSGIPAEKETSTTPLSTEEDAQK